MTVDGIGGRLALGLAGVVVGWAASGLTLAGRVDALERSLPRIEARLDELVRLQAGGAPGGAAAPGRLGQ